VTVLPRSTCHVVQAIPDDELRKMIAERERRFLEAGAYFQRAAGEPANSGVVSSEA
jgi:hypothetical protein